MRTHPFSAVVICPAALIEEANALTLAMGMTDREFRRKLSSDGEALTHYGLRSDATGWWVQLWTAENPPATESYTSAEAKAIIDEMSFDVKLIDELTSKEAHFAQVLMDLGLQGFENQGDSP